MGSHFETRCTPIVCFFSVSLCLLYNGMEGIVPLGLAGGRGGGELPGAYGAATAVRADDTVRGELKYGRAVR